jgi:2-polyprenyl-3-methyl-5-hydroxy-6-metoxy-1,4-benzoquinol methylase
MEELRSIDSDQDVKSNPLQRLDYFVEWGEKPWERLVQYSFDHFLGTDLKGQQVLDIGTRFGRMACLFALLGAKVLGLDLHRKCLSVAREEGIKSNVDQRVMFVQGSGDLSAFKDNTFDLVFSKSVLVVVPDLVSFLQQVRAKLKPGGKIMFLENARGAWWIHQLRAFRHKWDYTKARYFTPREIAVISEVFEVTTVKRCMFPPVVLILGHKKR